MDIFFFTFSSEQKKNTGIQSSKNSDFPKIFLSKKKYIPSKKKNLFRGELNFTLKEINTVKNRVEGWFKWDTNEKGKPVSGEVFLDLELTPPPGQETKIVEKILTKEEIMQLNKEEEEFDNDKEDVREIYDMGEELGRGAFAVVKYATHKKSKSYFKHMYFSSSTCSYGKYVWCFPRTERVKRNS